MRIIFFFFLLLPFLLLNTAFAVQQEADGPEPVAVQLLAEEKSIEAGRPFWVGIELQIEDGWDTYWINPGDAGFPTEISWHLPEGFKAGPLQWPYPERFVNDSLVGFGYSRSVLLLAEITPPKQLTVSEVKLAADVSWLACKDACVPGSATVELSLPILKTAPLLEEHAALKFERARAALPKPVEEGALQATAQNGEILLQFMPPPSEFSRIETVDFVPLENEIFDCSAPQKMEKAKGAVTLHLKMLSAQHPEKIQGVLLVSEKAGQEPQAFQVNAPYHVIGPSDETISFGLAMGLALAGGLILNVMPCVLPVIALKIFSFVKMAHERRILVFKHGLVFAAGVLASFWILSGTLLILRAWGENIGWGFQLQEPVFVAILAGILFLLGLSLFGVFELGASLVSLGSRASSSASSPLGNTFMSGILATLVATPCTGPLLGPALGFAMTLPPFSALAIFSAMGIGMAAPYLLFSAFPGLVRFLPRPGNWLITFKQLMGFLMMGTVVWLIWVFGAQTDTMAIFFLLSSFLMLAIGAWIFGRWGAPSRRKFTRGLATLLSVLIILTGGGAAVLVAKQHRSSAAEGSIGLASNWQAFDPEKVDSLREKGIPVFVDFTAKWCLICQANKVALHSSAVQKAFEDKGVVTMIADWTKKDARITEELRKLRRSGVPVYVLYPGKSDASPFILPQTLTGKTVIEYLDRLEMPAAVHAD